MKRRKVIGLLSALPAMGAWRAFAASSVVEVFKNPDCGCCSEWVRHLEAAGFAVKVTEVRDTAEARKRLGMPDRYGSCHTASVDGYVIEGHVPAKDIERLLKTRPAGVGLAVPGMPVGSPGMEMGGRVDPYDVLLVSRVGNASVFASYAGSTQ